MFASIVTRINEERLAMNKSTVGFINPVLYSHPEVLNDIKNGSNPGCGTNGFSAVEGYVNGNVSKMIGGRLTEIITAGIH